jgi:phage terminase small subunit
MPKLPNVLKTTDQLTAKQRKFVDIYVSNYGKINKADAVREAGYNPKRVNGASEIGSRLTNPNLNPHVVRYLEKNNRPLLQRALKIYSGSIVREPITSDTEPLATFNEPIDWIALKDLLFTAGEPRTSDKSRPTSA